MIDRITTMLLSDDRLLQAAHIALAAIAAASLGLGAARLARRTAPLRYGLLLTALCLAAAAPLLAAAAHYTQAGLVRVTLQPVASPAPPAAMPPADVQQTMAISPRIDIAPGRAEPTPPPAVQPPPRPWGRILGTWLIAVWAAGTVISLLHLGLGVLRLMRIGRLLVPCDDPRLRRCIQRAAELLGLTSLPRACTCPALPIPMVLGLFRPKLVIPASLLDELTDEQLQAVILHETAHIAHRDIWVGLLQRLAAALFWWCPLVHWLNRRLTDLREQICDNYVMRTQGDGFALAEVLVQLAERIGRLARPRLAVALGIVEPAGDGLEGRVGRLLQKECNTMTRMNRTAMVMTALFALLLGGVMLVTQVRAADKPKDAANATTPELRIRPAKQQGQFDLELRLPDKGSNPRMTVEAGKWGMLEVALDAATQLSFRARVNADKQQVRVSGQVTVAVTGGFQQWIVDDEPWPVGEWKALKETATSQPAAQEPPGAVRPDVFAKIIIPSKGGGAAGPHEVEPWIAKELSARGVPIARGVTPWIRLPEQTIDQQAMIPMWDGELDGQQWSCHWLGQVLKRTGDKTVTVEIGGIHPWTGVVAEVEGKTFPAKRGSRNIAIVYEGWAFIALHVGPPDQAATTQPADADWGEAVNGLQTRLTAEKDRVKAGEPIRLKLELRNVGTEVKRVDAQQAAVNNPLIVRGPKGEEIPFVAGQVSTLGGGHSIKPGETVVLFDGLDAAGQYLLTAPGVHTFQFRGRKAIAFLGEGETSIPPSNTIRVELTGDVPATGPAAGDDYAARLRAAVTARIGNVDGEKSLPRLEQLLADQDVNVRSDAVYALGWIGGDKAAALLERALKDRNAGVRIGAVSALANAGGDKAFAIMARLTSDQDASVRESAVGNLGKVGGEKALPLLEKVLTEWPGSDSNAVNLRSRVVSSLVNIGGEKAMGLVEQALADPDDMVRMNTVFALGRAGGEKAKALLEQAARDPNEQVRNAAQNALRMVNTNTPSGRPGSVLAPPPATRPAGTVRVRILSGSDRDPARDAVEEWIAKGLADAGSPVTSALTDWMTLSDNERELYSSMRGGRIIKGRVNDQGEVEITGMKIGPSPRIIAVRSGQKRVVKLTNYPGAGNVFIAVESVAVAAPATAPGAETKPASSRESTPTEEIAWGKETNGVVANLRALKTGVQPGEPIEFEIQVKNVSQKDVYLLSGRGGDKMSACCWSFQFDQWEWSSAVLSMKRVPLKPGETASVRCAVVTTKDSLSAEQKRLYWPAFFAPFRNVKTNAESVRLPAGNYRVYAKWGFKPEIPGDPGLVETNPIEVRITDDRESKQPALVITDADDGKTVQAVAGQEVRVSLKGERKQTGWEVSQGEGKALRPLKAGGTIGDTPIPALEFTPDKEGVDDIGTYTFRYTAVAKGTSTLRFVYVYPGGSQPTRRTATALVRDFRVTVEVGAPATRPAGTQADAADARRQAIAGVVWYFDQEFAKPEAQRNPLLKQFLGDRTIADLCVHRAELDREHYPPCCRVWLGRSADQIERWDIEASLDLKYQLVSGWGQGQGSVGDVKALMNVPTAEVRKWPEYAAVVAQHKARQARLDAIWPRTEAEAARILKAVRPELAENVAGMSKFDYYFPDRVQRQMNGPKREHFCEFQFALDAKDQPRLRLMHQWNWQPKEKLPAIDDAKAWEKAASEYLANVFGRAPAGKLELYSPKNLPPDHRNRKDDSIRSPFLRFAWTEQRDGQAADARQVMTFQVQEQGPNRYWIWCTDASATGPAPTGGAPQATQPAMNPAAVDPKTASLADALTDWIALLEKDDAKTATARWATNAAVGKVAAEWKALRECHKQHDYRRWIENSSDKSTTRLVPGGAKQVGEDTTFRVGGHGFGHLHVMWEKTQSGWRIASILECN